MRAASRPKGMSQGGEKPERTAKCHVKAKLAVLVLALSRRCLAEPRQGRSYGSWIAAVRANQNRSFACSLVLLVPVPLLVLGRSTRYGTPRRNIRQGATNLYAPARGRTEAAAGASTSRRVNLAGERTGSEARARGTPRISCCFSALVLLAVTYPGIKTARQSWVVCGVGKKNGAL